MKPIWCAIENIEEVSYGCWDNCQADCMECGFYINLFKGNQYVDNYIEKVIKIRKEKKALKDLSWSSSQVTISPAHGIEFRFQVRSDNAGSPGFLSVKEAKSLGKWLLEVTEGIEHTYNIVGEINRRSDGND